MNDLERQLASLLKEAPGDPPITLDATVLLATGRRRRRSLAPIITAAAVLAIAWPVAIVLHRGTSLSTTVADPRSPTIGQARDPHEAALRTAETIIATAPILPGATRVTQSPLAALNQPATEPGAQHVQRTRFWTAPGNVAAAISYLQAHPPKGMKASGSHGGRSLGQPESEGLDFAADEFRSLQYTVVAYRGGVAVRADAQVLWAPARSPADRVSASLTSVDVLVVRQDPQRHRGAPTVRRTLTGAPANALARFFDQLPRAVPGISHCPAEFAGEHRYDQLVFHGTGPSARVVVDLTGCASTTFQRGSRPSIQLSQSYVGGVQTNDHAVLTAVGLPTDYGH